MSQPAASPVILLAFANDRDDYLPSLQRERACLFEALQTLDDAGAIQVHKQEETSTEGLFKTLNRYAGRIAIIHYAGHASGTALQLETAGGAEIAHATGLAQRLAQLPALQLVFLNGCATRGQVATLLAAGVKAVIATSVKIEDRMATDFAAQFYESLARAEYGVSIESAFASARAFLATRDPARPVERARAIDWDDETDAEPAGPIWGLYTGAAADTALAWCLPATAISPADIIVAQINSGSISLADLQRVAAAAGVERSAAAASPVSPELTQSFTDTLTALATADDPADRRAAASVVRGDDAGAIEQIFALAEADAVGADAARAAADQANATADAKTASAAARFRQAGALAALTDVTRAIACYTRATDLDPGDFAGWIELARLHRTRSALAESRRCTKRARQVAATDRDRSVAGSELGDLDMAGGSLGKARSRFTASHTVFERLAAVHPYNDEFQYDVSISHGKLGVLATASGDLAEARRRFSASLEILERLAAADSDNSDRQRGLSIIYMKLGDLAFANGNLAEARRCFTACLEILSPLATADPHGNQQQRDLSITYLKLGELATVSNDPAKARRQLTAGLAIADRLAAADPDNSQWQRDVSLSHNMLGNLATASGDLAGACRHFTASVTIAERLATADPHNREWQRDLSIGHLKLGEVAAANDDRAEARRRFTASQDITERLAAADPRNSQWQRDLAIGHNRLGEVATTSGDLAEARRRFAAGLAIAERLAAADPQNSDWQRDLWHSRINLGTLAEAEGDIAAAVGHYRSSLPLIKALAAQAPDIPGRQVDLAYSRQRLVELGDDLDTA